MAAQHRSKSPGNTSRRKPMYKPVQTHVCILYFIFFALSLYGCGDQELSQIEEEAKQIQNTEPEPIEEYCSVFTPGA
jgi:hypothetical protein